jgi:serine protease Do
VAHDAEKDKIMKRRFACFSFLLICFLFSVSPNAEADDLKITSTPPGATVQIDGVKVGVTPYEMKVPGGYFHKTHSVFGARLEHPMSLRISMDGYTTKEIEMTEGPMQWVALNGTNHGNYWLLKTAHFDVTLERASKSFTGSLFATAGNSKVEMRPEMSAEDVVERSKPAVVLLSGPDRQGTGFLITDTGVIATNAHVASGRETLSAIFPSGQQLEATVIYVDQNLDFALLKVDGTNLPHLVLADLSTVRQGQTSIAIGNPGFGMPFTVSKGIVSAVGHIPAGSGTWIQTDTAINPGNSGGPLLNLHGEVVGITSAKIVKSDVQGIAFALSSGDVLEVMHRFYPTAAVSPQDSTKMPEGTGTVNITSEPDGADVFLDGAFVGNSPATLKLSAGVHTIRIKSAGRVDWERSITVQKDSQVSVKATLKSGS